MALYHFSVKQVSRGKGQTVVNSAAYISGQKLYNDYYGQTHDYTKKSGVVFTEILTPEYVPERLTNRETLWNEVEKIEKGKRAQLAYTFDIALQNELTLDENIELARAFCREQFVARGMIVDLAVHEGKSKNEDEPDNPHFHVLAPIRPFTEEGSWGNKQRREYVLDEDGNQIKPVRNPEREKPKREDTITNGMLHWSYTPEQKEEMKKALAAGVPKATILTYFYPEVSVERMSSYRKKH